MSDKSIEITTVATVLGEHVDQKQKEKILKELLDILREQEAEKEKVQKDPPIPKKSIIILTALPKGITEETISEMAGFITEIAEEDPARELKNRVREAKGIYNESKKAKKNPATSLGELFEHASLKVFKEAEILKKPKGPVEFVYIPNRG